MKYDLPQTQIWLDKYQQYQTLVLTVNKTQQQLDTLAALQVELAPYLVTAQDFNAKESIVGAQAKADAVQSNLNTHTSNYNGHVADYNVHGDISRRKRSSKDAEDIFTTVEWFRTDNTLAKKSVLSGGTTPKYTTRTVTYYAANGTNVVKTQVYSLTYDSDDLLIEEVPQ